jgi:hypothetical protein
MLRSRTKGGLAAALLLFACGGAVALRMADWPLWRGEQDIEQWIVRRVPLGTDASFVRQFIAGRGWKIESEWQQQQPQAGYGTHKGTHVIHAYLGAYRVVFRTDLDAFFGFDKRGRLVDVHVRKMVDSI